MWYVPGKLHDASLRIMRRLMHCMLLLPPRPQVELKVLYTIVLLIYLIFVLNWRFSFNYHVVYDLKNDHVTRNIDLLNFVGLTLSHAIVAMELLWKNRSEQVELQLQRLRHILRVQFEHNVNLRRIRWYSNTIFASLVVRVLILATVTIYVNFVTDNLVLLFYSHYSEVVLLMRFSEFTMYSSLILCFYRDLCEVSTTLIADLESTSPEMCSVRHILLDRLFALQHLHGLLWNSTRLIEQNFELSLISIMLKLLVNTSMLPYWIFINATTTKSWAIIQCAYPEDHRFHIAKCISLADCVADQLCQLVEIIVPCLICTHCELIYRQFKSFVSHTLIGSTEYPTESSSNEHLVAAAAGELLLQCRRHVLY